MSEPGPGLEELRGLIDAVDLELLRLLNDRAALVLEVQALKRRLGLPPRAPEREEAILHAVTGANPGPLPGEAVREIFRALLRASLDWLAEPAGGEHPKPAPPAPAGEAE